MARPQPSILLAVWLVVGTALAGGRSAGAQGEGGAAGPGADAAPAAGKAAASAPAAAPAGGLEPKAVELLKAMSARLAEAKAMTFTAVVFYESPSNLGPPLAYTTKSQVTMQRPDKLRVVTLADGPPSEFFYDGKTMTAFAPKENLAATAPAPPTLDAALEAAYREADIYFPFSDVIVSDPYRTIGDGLREAFTMGQSEVVGDTTTDMVAYGNDYVFAQIWIGAEDKLPRRLRAVFLDDPSRLRHELVLSDWKLDPVIPPAAFEATGAAKARAMPFARPSPPPGAAPEGAPPKPPAGGGS